MPIPGLLLGSLIGGGAGLLTYPFKKAQADKERQFQAEMARWSPWTRFQANYVQDPSLVGDVLTGAGSGLALGAANQWLFGAGGGTSGVGPVADASEYGSELDKLALKNRQIAGSGTGRSSFNGMLLGREW